MSTVRAIESCSVRDPEAPGLMTTIAKDEAYPSDHPLVKAYAWAFASDVEDATAEPGRKRRTASASA